MLVEMENTPIEGDVHLLVTNMGLRKWKKRYLVVRKSNLMLYEKQEDISNPNPLLKVSFYEIKQVTEATFIGDQATQGKKDAHNCGFKIDYGGHHSLSLLANSQEERGTFVKCLQETKLFWQQQTTPTESRAFFDKSSESIELLESCAVNQKDPLGLVGKEAVQMREGFEGTCSVRLLYSDGSTQNTSLSSNMTGEDVLEQVQDLSGSSRSSLYLLDTKGVVQNLNPQDKPGPILARLYGLCVVEPQNRVFVVHFQSGDWIPLILPKGVTCQQIIQSKQIKDKISDNQISNPALFIRKLSELQAISTLTAGEVQLHHQECPAELLYTQTSDKLEPKQTILILRPGGAGNPVSKPERNRTMTIKEKYALLSSPLSKAKNQRNFEMIYDEAIENLENDPLQSSVLVPRFEQGMSEELDDPPDLPKEAPNTTPGEEIEFENSVELLPTSEPRGRLQPLPSTSPSKSEGVKKLLHKTFHTKRNAPKSFDETTQSSFEGRRGRTTALSISEDDEHMAFVDEAIRGRTSDSHPFEMSIEENQQTRPKPHLTLPTVQPTIPEEPKMQLVRPSSLAPMLSAREIARHVTSAKTPDEENNPLSPTSFTQQEIAKYPTIKNSSWQQMEANSKGQKKDLDKDAIITDLHLRANQKIEDKTTVGAVKVDERQPILIPKFQTASTEARAFQILSPALLRTWVLNKSENPPPKIQVNRSILEWKNHKWVLAADSHYSDVNVTSEENKSIFKLPGEIELVYFDKSRNWSVTGPKVVRFKDPIVDRKRNGGSSVKTNVTRTKMKFTRQAVAQYSNIAGRDDELAFNEGEVMFIVSQVTEEWLMCENKEGVRGYVPTNYVIIQDYTAPSPPPTIEEEEVKPKPQVVQQVEDSKNSNNTEESVVENVSETPEGANEEEIPPPEPPIDFPTRLSMQLREKLNFLQTSVDPIIWHSGATRDPEMKKQLLDDRKTPAVAVLIRGNLTSALADIILRGLKSRSSFFQIENNHIWTVVLETVKYRESILACASAYRAVEDISFLSEVTNTLGSPSAKFRSFVCQALNNNFLESWLHALFFDLGGTALENLYDIDSFVVYSRHVKILPLLKEMLLVVQPLDALGFQLSINFEREVQTSEGKWLGKGGIGRKFGDWFVKTMTNPITPSGVATGKNSSRTASRENLAGNLTSQSISTSPNGENNKLFVTPGESILKGNVTVDTATEVATADPTYRTIGPRKSIEHLNKIVVGDSKIQEENPEDVKT